MISPIPEINLNCQYPVTDWLCKVRNHGNLKASVTHLNWAVNIILQSEKFHTIRQAKFDIRIFSDENIRTDSQICEKAIYLQVAGLVKKDFREVAAYYSAGQGAGVPQKTKVYGHRLHGIDVLSQKNEMKQISSHSEIHKGICNLIEKITQLNLEYPALPDLNRSVPCPKISTNFEAPITLWLSKIIRSHYTRKTIAAEINQISEKLLKEPYQYSPISKLKISFFYPKGDIPLYVDEFDPRLKVDAPNWVPKAIRLGVYKTVVKKKTTTEILFKEFFSNAIQKALPLLSSHGHPKTHVRSSIDQEKSFQKNEKLSSERSALLRLLNEIINILNKTDCKNKFNAKPPKFQLEIEAPISNWLDAISNNLLSPNKWIEQFNILASRVIKQKKIPILERVEMSMKYIHTNSKTIEKIVVIKFLKRDKKGQIELAECFLSEHFKHQGYGSMRINHTKEIEKRAARGGTNRKDFYVMTCKLIKEVCRQAKQNKTKLTSIKFPPYKPSMSITKWLRALAYYQYSVKQFVAKINYLANKLARTGAFGGITSVRLFFGYHRWYIQIKGPMDRTICDKVLMMYSESKTHTFYFFSGPSNDPNYKFAPSGISKFSSKKQISDASKDSEVEQRVNHPKEYKGLQRLLKNICEQINLEESRDIREETTEVVGE